MKFNPITKILYTEDNKLIKKMYCPYPSLQWQDFSAINGSIDKMCDICEHRVVDAHDYTEEALFEFLQEDPNTCLKVDLNQKNIRIVHNGE